MKIFNAVSESPLKVRKIAVYRFLISFLVVLEFLRFKDLKNDRKMVRKMRGLRYNQSKLIKSVMSCDGHLILNNP